MPRTRSRPQSASCRCPTRSTSKKPRRFCSKASPLIISPRRLSRLDRPRAASCIPPAKAAIAREAGADHVVVYAEEDFAAAVKRITSGRGVDVVYDAVGLDTYIRSMDSLRPRGLLALYGEASGLVPPIDPRELLF